MPSLAEVSNFIIQPVLRQARRFSSGFATEEPAPVNVTGLQHQRTRSASASAENAILEGTEEEDRIISIPDRTIARTDLRLPDRTATGAIAHEQYAREHATATTTLQMQATQILDRMRNTPDRSTTIPNPPQPLPTQNATVTPANEADTAAAVLPLWADDTKKSTLPEDDGMGQLRRRILAVQSMDISQGLKAQLMHQMLIEGYMKSQLAASQGKLDLRPESPTSQMMRTEEHAQEPSGPLQALKFWSPSSDGTSAPLDLPLSEEDLKPTYCPPQASPDDVSERMENMEVVENGQRFLGCEHYRRNVKLQCATCERWYTCRFCHDAAEDHVLPRKDTKNMLCMLCGAAQRASDTCIRCGESAAYYFCGVCKLWNDDPNKSIYHCSDCGLCRVGQGLGKDFFHCKKCMACISMTGPHKCIERSTDCDCPICGDYMFNSPKPVVFMQCGHSIHRHCFNEHMKSSYKCPLCSKSCVNMEYQFRNYDVAILTQPMPVEYRDARAVISCNDCSAKSQTAYHWLGLKCTVCNSYNTVQLQLLHMPGQQTHVPVAGGQQPTPPPSAGLPVSEATGSALAPPETLSVPSPSSWSPSRGGRAITPRRPRDSSPSLGVFDNDQHPLSSSPLQSLSRFLMPRAFARSVSPSPEPESRPSTAVAGIAENAPPPAATGDTAEGLEEADEDEVEDILDFWGRSAESAEGEEADEEEEEESSDDDKDSDDDLCDEDDNDEEEDENEIVLFGHR